MSGAQLDIYDAVKSKPAYHNTIPIKGDELIEKETKARRQQDIIFEIFKKHKSSSFTPFQILDLMLSRIPEGKRRPPITSIRRGISNLEKEGHLYKTGEIVDEREGSKNNKWRWKE